MRRWQKFALGWVVVLGLCALVEIGFRCLVAAPEDAPLWIPISQPQGGEAWRRSPIHVADGDLFWRNRANVDVMFRGARVVTNEFGMRSGPITIVKPAGVYRVLSLGESTTFGERVGQDEPYSAVLERKLNERHDGRAYQVLNAGSPGYSIAQSCAYLRIHGLAFAPDLVMIYHGYNDFLPTNFLAQRMQTVARDTGLMSDLALIERQRRLDRRISSWTLYHSRTLQWIMQRLHPSEAPQAPVAETTPGDDPSQVRVPAADRSRVLDELCDLAQGNRAHLVILVPAYATFDAHRELLLAYAREHQVAVLDMEAAVQRAGGNRSILFADRVHPGARLHQAMGELIAEQFTTLAQSP